MIFNVLSSTKNNISVTSVSPRRLELYKIDLDINGYVLIMPNYFISPLSFRPTLTDHIYIILGKPDKHSSGYLINV